MKREGNNNINNNNTKVTNALINKIFTEVNVYVKR
jgi:hypothetical protein